MLDLAFAHNDIITAMFELKLMSMCQTEDYNQCGIFLLMACLDYFSPISKKDASTSAQDRFKKKIALYIYEHLLLCYKEEHDVLNDHLVMYVGDVLDKHYVSMFRNIHHLFNIGILTLNMNENENANKY